MSGDNAQAVQKRWILMRSLYERGILKIDELAVVAGVEIDVLVERSCRELWQITSKARKSAKTAGTKSTSVSVSELREANKKTAKQVSSFLRRMLALQTRRPKADEEIIDDQTKTKNVLVIAKGVLTIEEMIANLDKLTNGAERYPQDALEFHRKLEKQIATISNEGTTN